MADSHALPRHQFDGVEQQQEVSSLGMWVFLVTEIMFFGGLFTGYAVYRMHLRYSSGLIWIVWGTGIFWVMLLLTVTLSDYLTRSWLPVAGW